MINNKFRLEKNWAGHNFECTSDNPWDHQPLPQGVRISHPDAVEIDDDYGSLASGGSYIRYECPHCLHHFWVQLSD